MSEIVVFYIFSIFLGLRFLGVGLGGGVEGDSGLCLSFTVPYRSLLIVSKAIAKSI